MQAWLFALCVGTAAFLLFLVEPMLAKKIVPIFGGSAAVWAIMLAFFQTILCCGYCLAHILARMTSMPKQLLCYGLAWLTVLAYLPLAVPVTSQASAYPPAMQLLLLLGQTIAIPFLLLATVSPLVQRWYALASNQNPYRLYAASNIGSFLALLVYPFLLEPYVALSRQIFWWSAGLAGFVVAMLLLLWSNLRNAQRAVNNSALAVAPANQSEHALPPAATITISEQFNWLFLAAIPSALLNAITNSIATDFGSAPFFWMLPLSIYLASFVWVFGQSLPLLRINRISSFVLTCCVLLYAGPGNNSQFFHFVFMLVMFACITLSFHATLAARKPTPAKLTNYYVCMALGGALGGLAVALLAPVLFSDLFEYPLLLLVSSCWLFFQLSNLAGGWLKLGRLVGISLIGLLGLTIYLGSKPWLLQWFANAPLLVGSILFFGSLLWSMQRLEKDNLYASLALAIVTLLPFAYGQQTSDNLLWQGRSFFGTYRLLEQEQPSPNRSEQPVRDLAANAPYHLFMSGTTLHGVQLLSAEKRLEPTTYYHRKSPIGDIFTHAKLQASDAIGVIGLGVGTLASYALPGQAMDFYELDPLVARMATDSNFFTFLQDSPGKYSIVLGDGRKTLQQSSDAHYQLLILDAYTSDAIGLHLLTLEAFSMFLQKITPSGLLAIHISNRYYDLAQPIGIIMEQLGQTVFIGRYKPKISTSIQERFQSETGSIWLLIDKGQTKPSIVAELPNWQPLQPTSGPLFTDEQSSLVQAIAWRGPDHIGDVTNAPPEP